MLRGDPTLPLGTDYYIKDWRNSQLAVLLYRRKNMINTNEIRKALNKLDLDYPHNAISNVIDTLDYLTMSDVDADRENLIRMENAIFDILFDYLRVVKKTCEKNSEVEFEILDLLKAEDENGSETKSSNK